MVDRSGRRSAEQQNVLLVDDSFGITPYRRRLEARGYHVIITPDVDAALMIARQAPPLAIFITAELLGSGRTPFLQALRRDDHTRHIPVTVLPLGNDDSLERLGLSRISRELW